MNNKPEIYTTFSYGSGSHTYGVAKDGKIYICIDKRGWLLWDENNNVSGEAIRAIFEQMKQDEEDELGSKFERGVL